MKKETEKPKSGDFFDRDYFFGRKKSNYKNYRKWDNDRYWQPTLDNIKKYKIEGSVLEIGCAFGFLLKRLKPYFKEICGIDISEYALKVASKEAPFAHLERLNLSKSELPFEDDHFDLIVAFDVLEHTNSIKDSLLKILPKIRKNGFLMLTLPIKDTWAGRIFHRIDRDQTHECVPRRKEILKTVNNLNLEIVEEKYSLNAGYLRIPNIPTDIELILRKKN